MSPEQESGQELDNCTDIYSLAVTLYEALAGHRPGVGAYDPLSQTVEAVPQQIDSLIQDCLVAKEQRLQSAREFSDRLAAALRVRKPLVDVLARGRLYEISLALKDSEFTADSLAQLPEGQRTLLLVKLESIIDSEDESLRFPAAEMLEIMLMKGLRLKGEEYRRIVRPAIIWAFETEYPRGGGASQGRRALQRALSDVCLEAGPEAHTVLREELEQFGEGVDLFAKENWYLHTLRDVLSCLMANSAFTCNTTVIANLLTAINNEQRSREQPSV